MCEGYDIVSAGHLEIASDWFEEQGRDFEAITCRKGNLDGIGIIYAYDILGYGSGSGSGSGYGFGYGYGSGYGYGYGYGSGSGFGSEVIKIQRIIEEFDQLQL